MADRAKNRRWIVLALLVVGVVLLRNVVLDRLVGPAPTPVGPGFRPVVWTEQWEDGGAIEESAKATLGDGECSLAPGGRVVVRFRDPGPAPRRLDWVYRGDRLLVEIARGTEWRHLLACPPSGSASQLGMGLPDGLGDGGLAVRVSTPADGAGAVLSALALSDGRGKSGPPVLVEPGFSRAAAMLTTAALSLVVGAAWLVRRRRRARPVGTE